MTAIAFVIKYWREILLGLLAILVISAGLYVKHVFTDRARLQGQNATLKKQVLDAEENAKLTNRIAEAISQIRVRSQINVSRIESQEKPRFVDARPLPFIPGGVLQNVYSSPVAPGATPGLARGISLRAGDPPGGILHR